jgi:hypothetical protein
MGQVQAAGDMIFFFRRFSLTWMHPSMQSQAKNLTREGT